MFDTLKNWIGFLDQITKSDFALAAMLLLVVALCLIVINNLVSRMKQELRLALLECREDSLKDMRFNNSLVSLVGKYQIVVFNLTEGRAHPQADELRRDYIDLRQHMHAETNRRVTRVEEAKKLLDTKREGLFK